MSTSPASLVASETSEPDTIHLALSGGGFRAALFHLGVIGFLNDRELLGRVKTICSVSGGSVLAAHMVAHWADYITKKESFRRQAKAFANWTMNENIIRAVFERSKKRVLSLRALDCREAVPFYEKLLNDGFVKTWQDFEGKELPDLYIIATHLNTGLAGGFNKNGFYVAEPATSGKYAAEINALAVLAQTARVKHTLIARAVAASAAFPPVFAPIPLTEGNAESAALLTDGGVFDNSGIKFLQHLFEKNKLPGTGRRLVIASDAGREYPPEIEGQYDHFLSLALRVTDTQADRIAKADTSSAQEFFKDKMPFIRVSIHETVAFFPKRPDNHSEHVQELIGRIRTELDPFTSEEVLALYQHGYLVAQQSYLAWLNTGEEAGEVQSPFDEVNIDKNALAGKLERSSSIQNKSAFIRLIVKWLALPMALLLLIAGGVGYLLAQKPSAPPEAPVIPRSHLAIDRIERDAPGSWLQAIPIVYAALRSPERRTPYIVITKPFGTVTLNHPHAAAGMAVETGNLKDCYVHVVLDRLNGDQWVPIMIENARAGRYPIPFGPATDRIRIILVSKPALANPEAEIAQNISITFQ